jgi:hypothetical protein
LDLAGAAGCAPDSPARPVRGGVSK